MIPGELAAVLLLLLLLAGGKSVLGVASMSKLGLVCLCLVVLALGAEFYIAAKLGMRRGEVADELRKVMDDSEKAIAALEKAQTEATETRQALALTKLGWGYEWEMGGGNPSPVQAGAGKLRVTGLGINAGLVPLNVLDAAGQPQIVAPVVHVFKGDGNSGSIYIGEFKADVDQLTADSCVLSPQWNISADDVQEWDFSNGSRFRTQIPAGGRSAVENLLQTIQRTNEQIVQTGFRIQEQQRLNVAAEAALATRRNELLGDPAAADNADHPEYKLGLVQALEDLEEERNGVQVAVDRLRRLIKSAAKAREGLVAGLKQVASQPRKSGTQLSQRAE